MAASAAQFLNPEGAPPRHCPNSGPPHADVRATQEKITMSKLVTRAHAWVVDRHNEEHGAASRSTACCWSASPPSSPARLPPSAPESRRCTTSSSDHPLDLPPDGEDISSIVRKPPHPRIPQSEGVSLQRAGDLYKESLQMTKLFTKVQSAIAARATTKRARPWSSTACSSSASPSSRRRRAALGGAHHDPVQRGHVLSPHGHDGSGRPSAIVLLPTSFEIREGSG